MTEECYTVLELFHNLRQISQELLLEKFLEHFVALIFEILLHSVYRGFHLNLILIEVCFTSIKHLLIDLTNQFTSLVTFIKEF